MTLMDESFKESIKKSPRRDKIPFDLKEAVKDPHNIDTDKIKKRLNENYDYIKIEKYFELFKTGKMQEPKSIHSIKREYYDIYGYMPTENLITCYKYYNELKEKAIREINNERNTLSQDSFNTLMVTSLGLRNSNSHEYKHPIQNIEKPSTNERQNIMEHYKQMERDILKELIKDPQAIKYVDRKTASMYEYVLRKDSRLISELNTKDTKEIYKTMKMIEANVDNYTSEELKNSSEALGDLRNILKEQYGNSGLNFEKRLKEVMQKIESIIGDFVRQGRVLDPE